MHRQCKVVMSTAIIYKLHRLSALQQRRIWLGDSPIA